MDQSGTGLTALSIGRVQDNEPTCFLLPPLTRRGAGPSMIIVLPDGPPSQPIQGNGVPAPSFKWAEEGYTVIEIRESALDQENVLLYAIETLALHEKCTSNDVIGRVGESPPFSGLPVRTIADMGRSIWLPSMGKISPSSWNGENHAVVYATVSNIAQLTSTNIPTVQHLCGQASTPLQRTANTIQYDYPNISSESFALPTSDAFDYATEGVSHTRSLTFLKKHVNGPFFDLEAIWEEHTYFEFDNRSVEHTMNTMVQEPYVNHIPTVSAFTIGCQCLAPHNLDVKVDRRNWP